MFWWCGLVSGFCNKKPDFRMFSSGVQVAQRPFCPPPTVHQTRFWQKEDVKTTEPVFLRPLACLGDAAAGPASDLEK